MHLDVLKRETAHDLFRAVDIQRRCISHDKKSFASAASQERVRTNRLRLIIPKSLSLYLNVVESYFTDEWQSL